MPLPNSLHPARSGVGASGEDTTTWRDNLPADAVGLIRLLDEQFSAPTFSSAEDLANDRMRLAHAEAMGRHRMISDLKSWYEIE